MTRCPKCQKIYGDWREHCPICSCRLVPTLSEDPEITKKIQENKQRYKTRKRWILLGEIVFALLLIVMVSKISIGFVNQSTANKIKTDVAVYEEHAQYEDALKYMAEWRGFISERPELQEIWDRNANPYRAEVIQKAYELFFTEGYAEVRSLLYGALDLLGEEDELQKEIDRYAHCKPSAITEWPVHEVGEFIFVGEVDFGRFADYWDNMHEDLNGNSYRDSDIHFVSSQEKSQDVVQRSITYSLDQECAWLSGTVYIPELTRYCDFTWSSAGVVEIYGDGNLVYSAALEQGDKDRIKFRVWVADVSELTIVLAGSWKDTDFDDSRYYPKICLAGLYVERMLAQ